eukprot:362807-Chlamydomonas_euryale.AAC.1
MEGSVRDPSPPLRAILRHEREIEVLSLLGGQICTCANERPCKRISNGLAPHLHISAPPYLSPTDDLHHRGRVARGPGTKPRPIASSCVAMRVASWRVARGCIRSRRPELGAWCWWSEEWMACVCKAALLLRSAIIIYRAGSNLLLTRNFQLCRVSNPENDGCWLL